METKKPKVVAVSGGFDPLHIGHVRMFEEARAMGDKLVVILNNDNWLMEKKGFVFMPQEERKAIIEAYDFVDRVFITEHIENDPDRSVVAALRAVMPDVFCNGGDRASAADIPEVAVCEELGIQMQFGVGGGKIQSSSWLTAQMPKNEIRPWGDMSTYHKEPNWWVKKLHLKAGEEISLQAHQNRSEVWVCVDGIGEANVGGNKTAMQRGQLVWFGPGVIHQLKAISDITIVEVSHGTEMSEKDIKRYEDKYGRA